MKQKRIFALGGIAVVLGLILAGNIVRTGDSRRGYLFDRHDGISLHDVIDARRALKVETAVPPSLSVGAPESAEERLPETKPALPGNLLTTHTRKYFTHLQTLFQESTGPDEHLGDVRSYIFSEFPEEEAERIFELYSAYLHCETELMEEMKSWGMPTDAESAIGLLVKGHEFRRLCLGEDVADGLFGAEVKAKEYALRRGAVVLDDTLCGEEKEEILRQLNDDMWGDEADAVEEYPKPYTRYREKLLIYGRDLQALASDEEKQALIHRFREEFFAPDVVERLEAVDRRVAEERVAEQRYRAEEEAIISDGDLTPAEKVEAVRDLQDRTFGDEAEAFRRRETMRRELEKLQGEGVSGSS